MSLPHGDTVIASLLANVVGDGGTSSWLKSNSNKFPNDGSFLSKFMNPKLKSESNNGSKDASNMKPSLSANQVAAKAMQLRMKGLHHEADKLMKEAEEMKAKQGFHDAKANESQTHRIDGSTSRYIMHELSSKQKKKEEDAEMHLAHKIMRHQQYNISNQAEVEYDYDDVPTKKARKRIRETTHKSHEIKGIMTQQDRCQFCFENPKRPKHLVISIGNFTYLSIPPWQQVVPGHCCILTLQHESATRSVDDYVWEEIRNFKKCLIMMFAQQEKDCVFLETVMGLAKQRRHCLVECIPIPHDLAKQAPLYFKKAIDEAEDEWSQHNAKKLIDTSVKGLRASIPKDFPYFYVEFGLDRGFVHVIDDEKGFKSSFGLNVIRGMMKLPPEDMHCSRRHESVEAQKQAVASFAKDWEGFDWTNQLLS